MKKFTILKVGYTTGTYGNSGEYFYALLNNGKKQGFIRFSGQYGAENRVQEALEQKGWTFYYTPSVFGKMTIKEDARFFDDEHVAIQNIKAGKIELGTM